MEAFVGLIFIAVLVLFSILLTVALRYKKCPSDQIMVVYGKVGPEKSAKCIHGGAQFVWPFFQDYRYLSLRPMQIEINLTGALSRQNIRINTPSTYTIGISTEMEIMQNAAERLLSMTHSDIESTAREIIFGQQRLVIASMDIEAINANRDAFLLNIKNNVESELNKIGLRLINVNITDITDEEGYLVALGKKAAAEVTNRAKVEVAQQEKIGETGKAEAVKEKRIAIAIAEAAATKGEADASREKRIAVAEAEAEAVKGEAAAEKDQRITVKSLDSVAVQGENKANMEIAKSNADRNEVEEESRRRAEGAKLQADARIKESAYEAEEQMQIKRASMVKQQEIAEKVVPAEITKQQQEIQAEAEAEIARREARGHADAIFAEMDAKARGQFEILKAKADGFNKIVSSCQNDTNAAAMMLMVEKVEELVKGQVEAIKNIKIDKVVVWDSLSNGKSSTASFLSSMISSLPALHDVAKNAGVELPEFLGKIAAMDGSKGNTSVENSRQANRSTGDKGGKKDQP